MDPIDIAIYFRIVERSLLIAAVVVACISIMIAMRKQSQKLDVHFETGGGSAKFIATLYMPVFATLILVLILFVAVSNPFTIERGVTNSAIHQETQPSVAAQTTESAPIRLVGFGASEAENIRFIQAINNIECLTIVDVNAIPPWCNLAGNEYLQNSQPVLSQIKRALIGATFEPRLVGRCAPYRMLQLTQEVPSECETYLEAETGVLR
ncbi:MAG: hypothetical protein AAF092_06415 [Pseudomonadota bacterium]